MWLKLIIMRFGTQHYPTPSASFARLLTLFFHLECSPIIRLWHIYVFFPSKCLCTCHKILFSLFLFLMSLFTFTALNGLIQIFPQILSRLLKFQVSMTQRFRFCAWEEDTSTCGLEWRWLRCQKGGGNGSYLPPVSGKIYLTPIEFALVSIVKPISKSVSEPLLTTSHRSHPLAKYVQDDNNVPQQGQRELVCQCVHTRHVDLDVLVIKSTAISKASVSLDDLPITRSALKADVIWILWRNQQPVAPASDPSK